ncbi:GGDEF domain-containing protein [Calothrix membranacea FACHB-236]|nr:GGDEF domain-containing protein [Calothrix membranacea FACHB-236]
MKSLDDFRKPFHILEQQLTKLAVSPELRHNPISLLRQLQIEAERYATQEEVTHALNRRGEEWYVPRDKIRSIAKIDLYDMRQANRVYGMSAVDKELRRLCYCLKTLFQPESGDYVRRSSGSDEFKITSSSKSVSQLQRILQKFYTQDKFEALIPWDFGVGTSEKQADERLQNSRKKTRPTIIRQIIPDNHSETQRLYRYSSDIPSWQEFHQSYCNLIDSIKALALSSDIFEQLSQNILLLQAHVESEITADSMTSALNAIGRRWYLTEREILIKSVGLTDMRDMHEANIRYGSQAVDQDLQRFASVLLKEFRREDGFLVLRSEKAGDEFKIISCKVGVEELKLKFSKIHTEDIKHSLLIWNYGIGRDEMEANNDLYKNISDFEDKSQTGESQHATRHVIADSSLELSTCYLIAKPEVYDYQKIYPLVDKIAAACGGSPIKDLHCTIQSIRDVSDISTLIDSIQKYCRSLLSFEIEFSGMARVSAYTSDRIWLLANGTSTIKEIYQNIANISNKLNFKTYSYPVDEWKPHMKVVLLSKNAAPINEIPLSEITNHFKFVVKKLELTRQIGDDKWETIYTFDIKS